MAGDDEPKPMLSVEDLEDTDADSGMQSVASNDEWAFRRADRLQGLLPDHRGDANRKTEGEVFDRQTLMVLHKFLTHGVLRSLDFPISTGKEANVFRGTTPGGGLVAVKIFRVNTSTFKHVLQYIQGDERFEGVTGDKRSLVHAWTQKEFRNLVRMSEAKVAVPEPLKALQNVLVMEYLGIKEGPWPSLKDAAVEDYERLWTQLADDYVKMYNEAELVHADLSEYNVLVEGAGGPEDKKRARIIDVGQAVLKNHPMAHEFLARDLKNLTAFFKRKGVDAEPAHIMSRLKHERTTKTEKAIRLARSREEEDEE
ncbi:MAG: serine protein kinase RIO [Candidatus Thermoplasmatota archaeon]|jgi:RIO kinase 1